MVDDDDMKIDISQLKLRYESPMMSAAADTPKCSRCAAAGAAQQVWCSSTHRKSAAHKQTHCTQKMKNHKKEI
jgi:hypothetical protein